MYRINDSDRRPQYSNYKIEAIAALWDPSWKTAPLANCSGISFDNNLNLNGIDYGSIIKCSSGLDSAQYIYLNGTSVSKITSGQDNDIRDLYGSSFYNINCNGLQNKSDVTVPPKSTAVHITCDNSGKQYNIPEEGDLLVAKNPTVSASLPINCSSYRIP